MLLGPGVTPLPTLTVAVNVCSPVSALAPVSANAPVPPMLEKSPVTVMLVFVGLVPGFTTTVNVTVPPCSASVGLAVAAVIDGGVEGAAQLKSGDAVLRGLGIPTAKSAALASVSVQPLAVRRAAVVLLSVGVGPGPSKQFAVDPKPTKST